MIPIIFLIVVSGLITGRTLCQSTGVSARCPDGYSNPLNDTCYLLSHDKEPWINAVMSCQLLGGHLVEVETAEEAAHLKQLCQNKARPIYWIALSNKRNRSSWEWATSHRKLTTSSYSDWALSEPDNYGGRGQEQNHEESCVAMDNDAPSYHKFQWADIECYKPELYLCEAQVAPILPFISVGRK